MRHAGGTGVPGESARRVWVTFLSPGPDDIPVVRGRGEKRSPTGGDDRYACALGRILVLSEAVLVLDQLTPGQAWDRFKATNVRFLMVRNRLGCSAIFEYEYRCAEYEVVSPWCTVTSCTIALRSTIAAADEGGDTLETG